MYPGFVRGEAASGDLPCGGTDSDGREDAGDLETQEDSTDPDEWCGWGDCADTVISGP
jgi:hypothetical protein